MFASFSVLNKPLIYNRRLQGQLYGTHNKGVPGDFPQRRPVELIEYYFIGLAD